MTVADGLEEGRIDSPAAFCFDVWMENEPDKADEELDLAEELEYIAAHQKMFTKAEMAVVMRQAAEEIHELRQLLVAHEAVRLANSEPEGNA